MIALQENVQWGSSPKIYVSFYYEKVRDGANMKYRTQTVISPITGSSYFGYYINQKLSMNSSQKEDTQLKGNSPSQWSSSITYTSPWYTISNKTSGTTPVTFTLYTNSGRSNLTASYSMAVDPAYPTANQSLNAKTETTIIMNWSSDSTIDYLWYSTNNGSSWTGVNVTDGKSGTYTINGLNANTTYQIKTRLRRKDSQLTTDTGALSVTTYNYPYATSMPDFIIGNKVKLGFYNPLGRTFTFYIISNGTQISNNWTISGTSYTGVDAASSKTQLYATIPNVKSATYQVKCVYGSNTVTRSGGKVSINETECKPSITSVAYEDINQNVVLYTLNNQNIVRKKSKVQYTASGLTVQNSATIASCSVSVNGNSYNLTVSGTSATGGNHSIDSAINVTATFTLTDSRGLTGTKDITITMLDWVSPTAIITLQRHNNFYSETDINVDALYSSVDNKNVITLKYRYKKASDTSYGSWNTIQDNVTVTDTFDNNYDWNIQVDVEDLFAYKFYTLTLPKGMPIIFFDKNKSSTGFNCFPVDEKSVEINGENIYKALFYSAGDSETLTLNSSSTNRFILSGMLTNSAKEFWFTIPLPKSMANVTPTLSTLRVNVRKVEGGYLLSNSIVSGGYDVLNDSNLTVTAVKSLNNLLTIEVASTTAWNTTNNTPVVVTVENLQIDFS